MPAESGAQELRDGKHVLAMRHRREHVRLDPIAVEQYALLVTARAEVPRLARVREQVVVPAGVASQMRAKPWCGSPHSMKRVDHPFLERALQPARILELRPVALRATRHSGLARGLRGR